MYHQTTAGSPFIIIDGVKYPCTSVDITLSINAVPTAMVMVGMGEPLSSPTGSRFSSPAPVIQSIMARQEAGAYKDLISCTIIEEAGTSKDRTYILFKGFIITATLQKSPTAKSCSAQITCVSSAARLMCNPTSGPAIVRGGYAMLQWIKNPKNTGSKTAKDMTKGALNAVKSGLARRYYLPPAAPLSDRIGNVLTAVICEFLRVSRGDFVAEGEYARYRALFKSALTSRWVLSSALQGFSGVSSARMYDVSLAEAVAGRINGVASILDVLFAVIGTTDYMLCAAPRLHTNGTSTFEIMPRAGWVGSNNVPCVGIFANCLESLAGHYNPHMCLNTPDVYIVQMDNTGMSLTNRRIGVTTQFGIYSTSAATRQSWRRMLNGNTVAGALEGDFEQIAIHRAVTRPAPSWVVSMCRAAAYGLRAALNKKFDIREFRTPKVPEGTQSNESEEDKKKSAEEKAKEEAARKEAIAKQEAAIREYKQEMLNSVAKAMFMTEFGLADSCTISLPFGCSFGRDVSLVRPLSGGNSNRLEEHIGDLIAVFPDSLGINNTGIVGVLRSLHYNVSHGMGNMNCSYTAELTQVHSWREGNGGLQFPLYTRVF